jgi:glycosyltransferase involved in cell wall biosynthesis
MRLLLAQLVRRRYAAAVASHERMAQYVASLPVPIRVWDLIDVACVRQKSIAHNSTRVLQRLISAIDFFLIRFFERMLIRSFAETWVCTGIELRELKAVTRLGNPRVSRRGVSAYFRPSEDADRNRSTVMFMGQLAYEPNADGLRWFVRSIWPLIRTGAPSAVLEVVGPNPPRWLRDCALSDASISVTGAVESVEPYLQRAAVFVCPLRIGTGVRIKILEAMAAGCPVVSTTIGYRGIDAVPGRDLAVADTPPDFADEVLHLMRDLQIGVRMSASALRNVTPNYTPGAVAATVAERIRHLLRSGGGVSVTGTPCE